MEAACEFLANRLPREEARAIDAFWHRFERAADRARRGLEGTAPHFDPDAIAEAALGDLAGRLAPGFERAGQGWRLVLSPVQDSDRVLARAAMRRMPDLPDWSASDARAPAASPAEALARAGGAGRVFEVAPRRAAHRLVDLEASGPGAPGAVTAEATALSGALLGERMTRAWLGETRARPLRRGLLARLRQRPAGPKTLAGLKRGVEAIVARFEADCPDTPFAERPYAGDRPTRYRLSPADDPRAPRADCTGCESRFPVFAAARIARARVSGARFSRFDETFCGVQIRRGTDVLAREGALEDLARVVETGLMAERIGGLTGHGTGAAHVYLDLALLRIEAALPVIAGLMKDRGIETPAWMIFDEAGLETVTLPLTPGTPPRPH